MPREDYVEEIESRYIPDVPMPKNISQNQLAVTSSDRSAAHHVQGMGTITKHTATGFSVYRKYNIIGGAEGSKAVSLMGLGYLAAIPVGAVADYVTTGSLGINFNELITMVDIFTYLAMPMSSALSFFFAFSEGIIGDPAKAIVKESEMAEVSEEERKRCLNELAKVAKNNIPFKAKVRSFFRISHNAKYLIAQNVEIQDGQKSDVYAIFSNKVCVLEVVTKDPLKAWSHSLRSIITPEEMRAFEAYKQEKASSPNTLEEAVVPLDRSMVELTAPPKQYPKDIHAVPARKSFVEKPKTDWASEVDIIFSRAAAARKAHEIARVESLKHMKEGK